jgi:hypothetical protein
MRTYPPRAPHFELEPLPFRPKPREDELFSSWLCHIATGYSSKVYSFCHVLWPQPAIWNRDLDRSAGEALMTSIAKMRQPLCRSPGRHYSAALKAISSEGLFRMAIRNGLCLWACITARAAARDSSSAQDASKSKGCTSDALGACRW